MINKEKENEKVMSSASGRWHFLSCYCALLDTGRVLSFGTVEGWDVGIADNTSSFFPVGLKDSRQVRVSRNFLREMGASWQTRPSAFQRENNESTILR